MTVKLLHFYALLTEVSIISAAKLKLLRVENELSNVSAGSSMPPPTATSSNLSQPSSILSTSEKTTSGPGRKKSIGGASKPDKVDGRTKKQKLANSLAASALSASDNAEVKTSSVISSDIAIKKEAEVIEKNDEKEKLASESAAATVGSSG